MLTHSESPTYEDTASTGRSKFWKIRILVDDEDNAYLQTESWQTTTSGDESQHVLSNPKKIQGKNVGRSNETNDIDQAEFEMKSQIQKKIDKGYAVVGSKPSAKQIERPLPMLAQKWQERSKYIEFPCAVQPKLDGIRCISNGKESWTRNGKPHVKACVDHVLPIDTNGFNLDGELILLSDVGDFNATSSATKKFDPELSPKLVYHVFDVIPPADKADMPFSERIKIASALVRLADNPNVVLVETKIVNNEKELNKIHEENIAKGFEGTMIRNLKSTYKVKHRSNDLQKMKDLNEDDDEFEIIAYEEAEGNHAGCIVFVCRTKIPCEAFRLGGASACEQDEHVQGIDGNFYHTVKASPKWTLEQRREAFNNGDSFVGQLLTIKYQLPLNSDGVPRFPRGVGIRDDL